MAMRKSGRTGLIIVNVKPDVKRAINRVVRTLPHPENENIPMSMSRWASDLFERELKRMGFGVSVEKEEVTK